MCGRFVLDRKTTDLVDLFDVDVVGETMPEPSWNIAPTRQISIVLDSLPKPKGEDDFPEPVRRLESARWGLVPGWAKESNAGPPLFNARSEDAAEKASFGNAVKKRRAVIPASGYYEWQVVDGVKVPHYMSLPGDELLLFAGLYEWWRNPAAAHDDPNKWLLSSTILTRSSTGALEEIHDRMPVFLDQDLFEEWLDPQEEGSQELIDQVVDGAREVELRIDHHEVDKSVGSVQNDSQQLTAPARPAPVT